MMFLSLLHVDARYGRPGREWLRNLYRVHQRLWMAFPDSRRKEEDPFFLGAWNGPNVPKPKPPRRECGFLFRIEHDGPARILVQSQGRPDWDWAFQNAPGLLAEEPQLKEIDPSPRVGQQYRFRLLANVVKTKTVENLTKEKRTTKTGKVIDHRRRTERRIHPLPLPEPLPQEEAAREEVLRNRWDPWRLWLQAQGAKGGFGVIDTRESPLFMQAVHMAVGWPGNKKTQSYNAGLFEGRLACTDEASLRQAIINGVGRAKAFGCGLLSVAPVK